MPGPINALRFVHAAILSEANDLETRAHGDLDADAANAMREDLKPFDALMRGHTKGEEVGLFPRLAEKESQFAQTYLRDHELEHAMFDELAGALERVSGGDAAAATDVRKTASAIRQHCASHIGKENDLVLPWVEENFSPPEQAEMVGKILSVFTPQDMQTFLPWIVRRLDDETAAAYIGIMSHAQPPEVFAKSVESLKASLPSEQLSRLSGQVEALR